MSRILLLVNGLGLGNSTRSYAVIQRLLAAGAEVEVVTSDNGLWFFADKPEVGRVTEIPSLRYGQKAGRINIAATLSQAGTMLDTIRRAEAVVADTIARFRPAAVVTNSIYSLRPVRRAGLPLAAINNSDMVVRRMVGGGWPAAVLPQFLAVELSDYLFHRCSPILVISPRLDPADTTEAGPFRRVGPIVRAACRPQPARSGRPERVVVMLSGSVFGSPVALERDRPGLTIDVVGRPAPSGERVPEGRRLSRQGARFADADAGRRPGGGQRRLQRRQRSVVPAQADGGDPGATPCRAMGQRRRHPSAGTGHRRHRGGAGGGHRRGAPAHRRIPRRLQRPARSGQRRRARRRTDPGPGGETTAMKAALRFGRYCSVALLAAGGDWLLFALLASAIGLAPLTSLMAARVAGGLLSFLGNRYWTWGANRQIALTQQGRRFLLLYAFGYALSVALFRLLTEVLHLPAYPSKLATDLGCFVINFVVMNAYVFHARAGLARFRRCPAAAPGSEGRIGDARLHDRLAAEPKAFWNAKILGWEASRYGGAASPDLVEGVAGRTSSSVRFRLDAAARLLAPHLAGRRVVELGCGSGLLAERLLALGAASYQGYDFSEAAIARAKQRAADSPRGEAMRFAVAAITDLPPQGDALVVSLGLVDWLAPAELDHLFSPRPPGIVPARRLGTAPLGGAADPSRLCPLLLRPEERRLRASISPVGGDRRRRRPPWDRPADHLSPPAAALRHLRQRSPPRIAARSLPKHSAGGGSAAPGDGAAASMAGTDSSPRTSRMAIGCHPSAPISHTR